MSTRDSSSQPHRGLRASQRSFLTVCISVYLFIDMFEFIYIYMYIILLRSRVFCYDVSSLTYVSFFLASMALGLLTQLDHNPNRFAATSLDRIREGKSFSTPNFQIFRIFSLCHTRALPRIEFSNGYEKIHLRSITCMKFLTKKMRRRSVRVCTKIKNRCTNDYRVELKRWRCLEAVVERERVDC